MARVYGNVAVIFLKWVNENNYLRAPDLIEEYDT